MVEEQIKESLADVGCFSGLIPELPATSSAHLQTSAFGVLMSSVILLADICLQFVQDHCPYCLLPHIFFSDVVILSNLGLERTAQFSAQGFPQASGYEIWRAYLQNEVSHRIRVLEDEVRIHHCFDRLVCHY